MSGFTQRGGWWVVAQLGLFALFLVGLGVRIDVPAALRLIGWALAMGGAALGAGGLLSLGPNLTPYPEPRRDGRLVGGGAYRLVRHPIYGGLCIGAFGLALGVGSPAAMTVALGLVLFFRFKAHWEERRLRQAYPDYADYARRTRRILLPWLW